MAEAVDQEEARLLGRPVPPGEGWLLCQVEQWWQHEMADIGEGPPQLEQRLVYCYPKVLWWKHLLQLLQNFIV